MAENSKERATRRVQVADDPSQIPLPPQAERAKAAPGRVREVQPEYDPEQVGAALRSMPEPDAVRAVADGLGKLSSVVRMLEDRLLKLEFGPAQDTSREGFNQRLEAYRAAHRFVSQVWPDKEHMTPRERVETELEVAGYLAAGTRNHALDSS